MYVTVQFIILEILLGLIFLVILYFMLRELLKKIIRRELREIKEPLQVLANYLVEASRQAEDDDNPEDPNNPEGPDNLGNGPGAKGPLPASSPEKLPEEPVDIADEFVQLKNTNRISAYNIRVQKIWDLYKQNKITLHQYKAELLRLKKEFDIAAAEDDDDLGEKKTVKSTGAVKVEPLTPTPSASPQKKVKNIDTEQSAPTRPDKDSSGKNGNNKASDPKENNNKNGDLDIGKDKGNKAASL